MTTLQIAVKNEQSLFVCKDGKVVNPVPPSDSVNITITVIDANDPPQFEKEIADVYQKEEEKPGKVIFTPKVHDVDSEVSNIRFVSIVSLLNLLPHCESLAFLYCKFSTGRQISITQ